MEKATMTIKSIKLLLLNSNEKEKEIIIKELEEDNREAVKTIISSYKKNIQNIKDEYVRLFNMSSFERGYFDKGLELIAGIDEVGRGPLAGPVVACAVILPKDCKIVGINDSKKLTAKKREQLFDEITQKAIAIGIGIVDAKTIDEINILQATYKAMRIAILDMKVVPDILLNDAVRIPNIDIVQHPIIQGDSKSISIAAASIIAKVTRDKMMDAYHEIYPEYDFINNKGYGTKKHIEAITESGLSQIHRLSFVLHKA